MFYLIKWDEDQVILLEGKDSSLTARDLYSLVKSWYHLVKSWYQDIWDKEALLAKSWIDQQKAWLESHSEELELKKSEDYQNYLKLVNTSKIRSRLHRFLPFIDDSTFGLSTDIIPYEIGLSTDIIPYENYKSHGMWRIVKQKMEEEGITETFLSQEEKSMFLKGKAKELGLEIIEFEFVGEPGEY